MIVVPPAGAVQLHHSELLPLTPPWLGSPDSWVAPALEARTRMLLPASWARVAKSSLNGRLSVELSAFAMFSRPPLCTLPVSEEIFVVERRRRLMSCR